MVEKMLIQTNCSGPVSPWAAALGMLTSQRPAGSANSPFPALTPVFVDLLFDSFGPQPQVSATETPGEPLAHANLNLETTLGQAAIGNQKKPG